MTTPPKPALLRVVESWFQAPIAANTGKPCKRCTKLGKACHLHALYSARSAHTGRTHARAREGTLEPAPGRRRRPLKLRTKTLSWEPTHGSIRSQRMPPPPPASAHGRLGGLPERKGPAGHAGPLNPREREVAGKRRSHPGPVRFGLGNGPPQPRPSPQRSPTPDQQVRSPADEIKTGRDIRHGTEISGRKDIKGIDGMGYEEDPGPARKRSKGGARREMFGRGSGHRKGRSGTRMPRQTVISPCRPITA